MAARRWPRHWGGCWPLDSLHRAFELLALDPGLGGVIACGGLPLPPLPQACRIPPQAALTGCRTPWGWQPGLLDGGGLLTAHLDLLPPAAQAILTQRLDAGGCALAAACTGPPWAHLADRVAFLVSPAPAAERPPKGRPMGSARAARAIAQAALALNVEGHRAEAFTLRAAAAVARADGRRRLCEGDVAEAVALVLVPRARAVPQARSEEQRPEPPHPHPQKHQTSSEAPPLNTATAPLPQAPVAVRPALHGAPVRTMPGRTRRGCLDLTATLLAALPWQKLRGRSGFPPAIRPGDLRWQLRRPRLGRLIIFTVDGSGSMGRRRLGQAKGAVLKHLQEAYRRRDQVALITAAGPEAHLLLPPARAVEQARRRLIALPAGGATPLAGALLLARRLALLARAREGRPTLLLLLTDGRANQPLPGRDRSTVQRDLQAACAAIRQLAIDTAVVGEPGAEAQQLARWLGAAFLLPGRK
jgi:magnesium chelatase subunit D